jgi:hypothetical protein
MPGIDELLIIFKLAQYVGDMAWDHVRILAHGLISADSSLGHRQGELENML